MTKPNDGGPVGLASLRDWFAGEALATMREDDYYPIAMAEKSYRIADAMLVEREKERGDAKVQ